MTDKSIPDETKTEFHVKVFPFPSSSSAMATATASTIFKKDSLEDAIDFPYSFQPANSLINITKRVLNSPDRTESKRRGQIKVEEHYATQDKTIVYTGNDATFRLTLEQTKEMFAKKVRNGVKVFNFLLQKMNEQHRQEVTHFRLEDLVENGLYANRESAYKGLKNIMQKIANMKVTVQQTEYKTGKKKETAYSEARIIAEWNIKWNGCHVVMPPSVRNAAYITILPKWSNRLNENSYILLDYIFYLARQNTIELKKNGHFNINLDAIRIHMGLPSIQEVKNNQEQLIAQPILKAIEEIEDSRDGSDIKITPKYNTDGKVRDFLEGYLQIELDATAQDYMETRAKAQEEAFHKANRQTLKLQRKK